jgi:hypothetical protein
MQDFGGGRYAYVGEMSNKADAILVAAAPDLLSTLEDIARFLDGSCHTAQDADFEIYRDAALDAIKQAKGES